MSGAGGVYKPASEGLSKYFMCMLDDEDRNSKYRAGIAACFAEFAAENGGEMPTVLDIGVGTGMLSALCLEAGAKHVTAVDCNETMCNLARRHLKELAQKSRFEVVQAHAGKPPPFEAERRFDVVVSEILGTLTTSESMCKYVSIYAPHIRRFGADGRKVYMVPRRTEQKLALHAFERAALGEPLASLLLDAVGTGKLTPTNEGGLNLNLHLYPSTQVPGSCHVIHEEDYSRAAADPAAKGCAFEVKSSLEPQLVDVSAVDGRTELLLGLLEWEVTLWDGVVMRNSLEGYRAMAGHDGSPPVRTAAARGSAWGFFAVGVPQPPRHYIKLRAYAANPMSRSIPELAVDGDHSSDASRWVSEVSATACKRRFSLGYVYVFTPLSQGHSPQHWLALDLQQYYHLNRVQIYAGYEQATHYGLCSHTVSCWAGDLDAELEMASASDTGWTDIISHGEETTEMEHLDFTSISCRLVKLSIDQSTCASRSEWSDFTRVYEFEIYGQLAPEPTGRSRGKNVALNKPVLSDSAYGPNLSSCGSKDASMCVAERAVDGDTTSQQSRWLSTADDASHWLVIDLQVQ